MDELQVCEVEQIVDQQQVIARQIKPGALEAPFGVVVPVEILNRRRIS